MRVAELCERLDMAPPLVEVGTVPEWCGEGVLPVRRRNDGKTSWHLVLGSKFHAALREAQEAALAGTLAFLKKHRAHRTRRRIASWITMLTLAWVLGGVTEPLLRGVPAPLALVILWAALAAILYGSFMVFLMIRTRRNIYKIDRWVVDTCGVAVVEAGLEYARANPPKARGMRALFLRAVPSPDRRAAKLRQASMEGL